MERRENGTDHWNFGGSSFGVCDSLFGSENIGKVLKIQLVTTGHAAPRD